MNNFITDDRSSSTIVFTHTDLDGAGCELLMKSLFPNIPVLRVGYEFEDDNYCIALMKKSDTIIILDLSISPSMYDLLTNHLGKTVLMLDHHESALVKYREYYESTYGISDITSISDNLVIDTNRSGTLITFEYFYNLGYFHNRPDLNADNLREISEVVSDYDLWKFNYDRTMELQFLWSKLKHEGFVNKYYKGQVSVFDFTDEETDIINNQYSRLANSYQACLDTERVYVDNEGLTFSVIRPNALISLSVSMYLDNKPNIDYAVAVNSYGKSLSLRSKHVEVNKIAETLGGGGHKLAAGAPMPEFMDIPNSVINREPSTKFNVNKFNNKSDIIEEV